MEKFHRSVDRVHRRDPRRTDHSGPLRTVGFLWIEGVSLESNLDRWIYYGWSDFYGIEGVSQLPIRVIGDEMDG
jgi:hypothetical protein